MRRVFLLALATLAVLVAALPGSVNPATKARPGNSQYVVLYEAGASKAAAHAAIKAAGGTIVRENGKVGLATVSSSNRAFVRDVTQTTAIEGAARNIRIGFAPSGKVQDKFAGERLQAERLALAGHSRGARLALTRTAAQASSANVSAEPLADLQWDMRMIHATADGSHAVQPGDPGVLVGIIDTGIDGSHPDIAPNFNGKLSRNFTIDIPSVVGPCDDDLSRLCEQPIDGPCADEPDRSCSDPADVDENGHGTHVAGTVAAAANGLGIAGVAPNVTLVNLRAGQDSGFFFLQASVDALTYAGDHGIDIVNMSYFIDPWLFNCRRNPADSPAEQMEQRTIIKATQRALRYAHRHGVTLIAAAGNGHTDYAHRTIDETSPDFPFNTEKVREIDESCLDLPTEGRNVLSVTALGPSERKADYSDYGIKHAFVSAPGGWFRDTGWTAENPEGGIPNLILSTYAENVGREVGDIDETGEPTNPFVVKDCNDGTCAYYTYFQGTSMASPHAAGVASVIVSEFGRTDRKLDGLKLAPRTTRRILKRTATDHACPDPRLFSYDFAGRPPEYDALCEGSPRYNGFYGHGIVDALAGANFGGDDDDDDDDDN